MPGFQRRPFRRLPVLIAALVLLPLLSLSFAPTSSGLRSAAFTPGSIAQASPHQASISLSALFSQQSAQIGAMVMDMSGNVRFQSRPYHPHVLASVAKIYIMVAYLDSVADEQRRLTAEEELLLEQMIQESDNYAATDLWRRIGGYVGLTEFLQQHQIRPPVRAYDDSWGSMQVTAADLAEFLAALYRGELLPNRLRLVALENLSSVIDSQAWGLGSVRNPDFAGAPTVFFKNGWYPETTGWVVNSVGIVVDGAGEHVFVLLTDSQPTMEDGTRFLNAAVFLLRLHLGVLTTDRSGGATFNR